MCGYLRIYNSSSLIKVCFIKHKVCYYALFSVSIQFFTLLGKLLRLFYNEDCLRCGVFLGSFVAIFKVCELNIAF